MNQKKTANETLQKTIKQLMRVSSDLNGATGRLIVASMGNPEIKEAMQMLLDISIDIDEFYNEHLLDIDKNA